MKTKIYLLLFFISIGINFTFAQHENDNWRFGNNNWKFDNSTPNSFTHTTNSNPYIRYISSIISDKNTGNLLFYSNGYEIFNKNNVIMDNGNNLFDSNNIPFHINPADQSSIILPLPNSNTLYYVFYINGSRRSNDYDLIFSNTSFNFGLRYAIVDISLNNGLGKVISKNNILFSNSPTNALSSTFANDGNSYWIVTGNNGNFLSYKLDANGLNTTPIQSPGTYGNFIKISPNSKRLVTRTNNVLLYNFNNTNGTITNQLNIIPTNQSYNYLDSSDSPNSAEFSPDSNILYFISSQGCLCQYPYATTTKSGLSMYNISTNSLVGGYNSSTTQYPYPLFSTGLTASLQLATNGKIYLIHNIKIQDDGFNYREVKFGTYINNNYYSYDWGAINTPNVWSATTNPLSFITPQQGTKNGFSFPQIIPTFDTCPDVKTINLPIILSQNFQASQSIIASSVINDDLIVNYKAGQNVNLLHGFYVKATRGSLFHAYIGPCDDGEIIGRNDNLSESITQTDKSITSLPTEIKVYPNPASTFINIDSGNEEISVWELFDISGKNILKGSSKQVNVQGLPKANYIIKINTKNKQVTKKVIVN